MTSDALLAVSRQYVRFRSAKDKLKEQKRQEIIEEMHGDLVELGRAVQNARKAGFKVDEIIAVMGIKNRNFMYDALRAFEKLDEPDTQPEPEPSPEAIEWSLVKLSDSQLQVTMNDEVTVLMVNKRGIITDMPVEWLSNKNPNVRRVVKEIVLETARLWQS